MIKLTEKGRIFMSVDWVGVSIMGVSLVSPSAFSYGVVSEVAAVVVEVVVTIDGTADCAINTQDGRKGFTDT